MKKLSENPNAIQICFIHQELFFSSSDLLMSRQGKMRFSINFRSVHFAVTRAFELFENHFIHATARVYECCRNNGKAATFFHISCSPKEPFRTVKGIWNQHHLKESYRRVVRPCCKREASRVIESRRITTSFLCSTKRFAFSITISAT